MPTPQEYFLRNSGQILGKSQRGFFARYWRFNTQDAHATANVLIYSQMELPAVPIIHPYNPVEVEHAAFNRAVPVFYLVARIYGESGPLLEQIKRRFPAIAEIEQYICVQSNSWNDGHELLYRPHPWLNPNVADQAGVNVNFATHVALGFPAAEFAATEFISHDRVYSPNNAAINHLLHAGQTNYFYSLCVFQNRAALTLHVLIHPRVNHSLIDYVNQMYPQIENLSDYLASLAVFEGGPGFDEARAEILHACRGYMPRPIAAVPAPVVAVPPPLAATATRSITPLMDALQSRARQEQYAACIQMFYNVGNPNHHNIVMAAFRARNMVNLTGEDLQLIIQASIAVIQDLNPNPNSLRTIFAAINPNALTSLNNPELLNPQSALRQRLFQTVQTQISVHPNLQTLLLNALSVTLLANTARLTLA